MSNYSDFFASGGGAGGAVTANFKAASNISANAPVVLKNNGTIDNMNSTVTTNSSGSVQTFGNVQAGTTYGGFHYNYGSNTAVLIYQRAGLYRVVAGTNSNGTITWGSEVSTGITNSGGSGSKITYDPVADYYLAWGTSGSDSLYVRAFSVSGNTVTMAGSSATFFYYYYWNQMDAKYIPDIGTHVCYGVNTNQNPRMVNCNVNSSGTITSNYFNNASPPSAGNAPSSSGQVCSITDMGNGLVGCWRDSNSSQTPRLFSQAVVSKDEINLSAIHNNFGIGFQPTGLALIAADRVNKYIVLATTQGSSTTRYKIMSYSDFLNFNSSDTTFNTLTSEDGYVRGMDAAASGDIYLCHFDDGGSQNNHVRRFNLAGGYLNNLAKVTTTAGANQTFPYCQASPSEFSPETWIGGWANSGGYPQARNITFAGVNTNKDGFIGYAPEAITAGSVGAVNLANRNVSVNGLQSSQKLIDGEQYYENSSGTTLATSGTNFVGFGSDDGITVIGEAS